MIRGPNIPIIYIYIVYNTYCILTRTQLSPGYLNTIWLYKQVNIGLVYYHLIFSFVVFKNNNNKQIVLNMSTLEDVCDQQLDDSLSSQFQKVLDMNEELNNSSLPTNDKKFQVNILKQKKHII